MYFDEKGKNNIQGHGRGSGKGKRRRMNAFPVRARMKTALRGTASKRVEKTGKASGDREAETT